MEGDWPEEITNSGGWEEEFLGVHGLRMPAADMEVMNPINSNWILTVRSALPFSEPNVEVAKSTYFVLLKLFTNEKDRQ